MTNHDPAVRAPRIATQTYRMKAVRAHLRHVRHEIRTPINAIIGFGEMLQEECPEKLLPLVIDDIGALLATARSMTHAMSEIINRLDADPDLERRDQADLNRRIGDTLSTSLAGCLAACERMTSKIRGHESGEFGTDLYKITAACRQLFSFLANMPTSAAKSFETPGMTADLGTSDVSGAVALAQSLHHGGIVTPGVVLVVDDNSSNRAILSRRLIRYGYRVLEAAHADEAQRILADQAIDLVLLDVLLPGMDGYTLCRLIKADPVTASIPVLLVTALHERQDRLAGIAAGANDFLTKPIDAQDLLLRCRNALAAKRQFDESVEAYRKLQQLEALRDQLTHLIVHDMRSPLTGLVGFLDLFLLRSTHVDEKLRSLVDRAAVQARGLEGLINHVLDVSRLESGAMPLHWMNVAMLPLMNEAIPMLGAVAERVPVRVSAPADGLQAWCDADLVRRVLVNLLANAAKFSPTGSDILVRISRCTDGGTRIEIEDHGPGVDPAHQSLIFEKFGQVIDSSPQKSRGASSGLGLAFCRLAMEAHGGSIGVTSTVGEGSVFWLELRPRADEISPNTP